MSRHMRLFHKYVLRTEDEVTIGGCSYVGFSVGHLDPRGAAVLAKTRRAGYSTPVGSSLG